MTNESTNNPHTQHNSDVGKIHPVYLSLVAQGKQIEIPVLRSKIAAQPSTLKSCDRDFTSDKPIELVVSDQTLDRTIVDETVAKPVDSFANKSTESRTQAPAIDLTKAAMGAVSNIMGLFRPKPKPVTLVGGLRGMAQKAYAVATRSSRKSVVKNEKKTDTF